MTRVHLDVRQLCAILCATEPARWRVKQLGAASRRELNAARQALKRALIRAAKKGSWKTFAL